MINVAIREGTLKGCEQVGFSYNKAGLPKERLWDEFYHTEYIL